MVAPAEGSRNLEQQAETLFDEILNTGVFPPECTVHNMDETGLPGHNNLLTRVLEKIGTSSKGTWVTERDALHTPTSRRKGIANYYAGLVQYLKQYGVENLKRSYPVEPYFRSNDPRSNYSNRLHILVLSHTTQSEIWGEKSKKIMHILGNIYGPIFKYQFNVSNQNQAGDFHPLVGWMFEHFTDLENLYFEKKDIPHLTAKIAKGTRAIPSMGEVQKLVRNWGSRMGDVNLDSARVDKTKKLDAIKAPRFPRRGATSITQEFERLFINLDPRDSDGVRQALQEPTLGNEEVASFTMGLNNIHLLIYSLLNEVKDPDGMGLLTHLDTVVGSRHELIIVASAIRELANIDNPKSIDQHLRAIEPHLGIPLQSAIEMVQKKLNLSPYPGFGAARALLVHHTRLSVNQDPRAQDIEKLMYHMVEMASGREDSFLTPSERE